MYPYPISIFGGVFNIYLYGIMIAVGLAACFIVLFTYGKHFGVSSKLIDFIFYNGIASVVLGFGGAKLFQAFYDYIENPAEGFDFANAGMTFLGGLISGVVVFLIGYFLFRKRLDGRLIDVLPIVPCCILIAHGFGRIGCFFSGCCYGIETDSFLGVKFPHLSAPVHPTMLYEAAFLFIMFGVCTWLLFKWRFRYTLPLYLVSYGVFRFLIEYLRGDHRGALVTGMSPSQFLGLMMPVAGVVLFFGMRYFFSLRDAEGRDKANEE